MPLCDMSIVVMYLMTGQSKSLRGFVIKKEAVDDSAGCAIF